MNDLLAEIKRNAALALIAVVLVVGGLSYCAGQRTVRNSRIVAALVDTVRLTDSVVRVQTDTIVRYTQRVERIKDSSDALDSAVGIVNDSTVQIKPAVDSGTLMPRLEIVPPLVVADLRALRLTVHVQDTLIHWLYQRDTTRQWQLASRDKLIRELSQRHRFACGRNCGVVLGFTAAILIRKAAK
jgi:hypothetical protein